MKGYKLFLLALSALVSGHQFLCAQTPSISVTGEVARPLSLTPDIWAELPREQAELKDRNGESRLFSGVPIQVVLERAGVTTGDQLRGGNLTKYVLVKCADGYEVLFSLAELDSSFTDRRVILADSLASEPLPLSMGPYRLVVPGEKKPARSAYQVTEISVKHAATD